MAATASAHLASLSSSPKMPTDADRLVGQHIAAFRKAAGLSQSALGAALGVTFQQVQKYEKGQNRVGAGRLVEIAGMLGVPVTTLLGQEQAGSESHELFALLAEHGAADLLRAYAAIPPGDRRSLLIRTARALGGADQAEAA